MNAKMSDYPAEEGSPVMLVSTDFDDQEAYFELTIPARLVRQLANTVKAIQVGLHCGYSSEEDDGTYHLYENVKMGNGQKKKAWLNENQEMLDALARNARDMKEGLFRFIVPKDDNWQFIVRKRKHTYFSVKANTAQKLFKTLGVILEDSTPTL